MKKRLIFIILLIFIPLSLSSCSIKIKTITSGDYQYQIYKKNKKKVAEIVGLSDIGMEKEVIVIPKYIDGYRVNKIRKSRWGHDTFCSNDTKKIYITIKLDEFNKSSFNRHKVFYLGDGLLNTELYGSWDYDVFLPYNVDISKENIKNGGVWHANVTYMVDDEIYWIDECENGPIEYIPEEPKKDGFKFEGWYKDKDFLNKWDFEIDTVPPIKEIDHGDNWKNTWTEYVYEEIMLYAKFDLAS